jgi:hypothetical protein
MIISNIEDPDKRSCMKSHSIPEWITVPKCDEEPSLTGYYKGSGTGIDRTAKERIPFNDRFVPLVGRW